MELRKAPFGTAADGAAVTAYTLENGRGAAVTILDYGATVQSLRVPGRDGRAVEVVLGYDTLAEYEQNDGYLGAAVGRVANRIGGAAFSLNGRRYELAKNDGPNHLHGGVRGFDKRMWAVSPTPDGALVFSRLSPDGEEGYPGALAVSVTYRLTEENALCVSYDADAGADTLVSLTNHSYFNLAGGGSVLGHLLTVYADRFAENDPRCLPTGRLLPVDGTPFDFRREKPIGRDIGADDEQLRGGGGYDHNFVLAGRKAAVLHCGETGIALTVRTDLPGMQVYTANSLSARPARGGGTMAPRGAVCLETQLFPNALACWGFPSPILRAGRHMHSETVYAFSVF